ncbi:MAG: cisplatin damage response ATP-dependent DNA ligase [Limnobacter sp.]|nr:cisplatin damage response ATP-dependent DNA ligase [Limnobacter sp.]
MKDFVALFNELDESTSTTHKVAVMADYFKRTSAEDAAWAAYFLAGGKPKRTVPTKALREVTLQITGLPDWMFEECYQAVGDLAETIALLIPEASQAGLGETANANARGLSYWMTERILPLRAMEEESRLQAVMQCWTELSRDERFLFVKLVGGGLRVGVSKLLVTRALAQSAGVDAKTIATRMMGYQDAKTMPTAERYLQIVAPELKAEVSTEFLTESLIDGQPGPFFLAHPLQSPVETLGSVDDWLVEWKFDGIRAQVVKDQGQVWIWSRGEELISEQFPELVQAFSTWPDGVTLDGEILVWLDTAPAGFNALQARLNRKVVGKKLLQDNPAVFMAYDLLRVNSSLITQQAQLQRRAQLESFVDFYAAQSIYLNVSRFKISQRVIAGSWGELESIRQKSRELGVEGFMLKHAQSRYGVGRTKADGIWWKWKIDPMTIDCVLVYAQSGHGRRASLYTDYTFAVWDRPPISKDELEAVLQAIEKGEKADESSARGLPRLVPFAKAYSGLTDEEFKRVDFEIRKNTVDKFGPVRTVKPTLVFELGFEAIARSNRHKSGVAVRFPRMLRIRDDKPLMQADSLAQLEALLQS